jgi:hypothetical protein
MVAVAVVKAGGKVVLPLMPEMIRNEDGKEKQDCERKGVKRMLEAQGGKFRELKATVLGDDLYSDYYTCKAVLEQGLSFIFTCKEGSHRWLSETVFLSGTEKPAYVERAGSFGIYMGMDKRGGNQRQQGNAACKLL